MNKICNKCNIEKDIADFRIRKDKPLNYCIICERAQKKQHYKENSDIYKEKNKEYRKLNKDKIAKYHAEYRKDKDKISAISLKCYYKNREINKEKRKLYYINNKEKMNKISSEYRFNNPDYFIKYNKDRYENDFLYKLKCVYRSRTNKAFKQKGYRKNSISEKILGCSWEQFQLHIKNQLHDWMSYDNYGLYNGEFNYGWDIDHIYPLSNASTEDELIKLCHYTNLQPLCSKVNRDIKKANV